VTFGFGPIENTPEPAERIVFKPPAVATR